MIQVYDGDGVYHHDTGLERVIQGRTADGRYYYLSLADDGTHRTWKSRQHATVFSTPDEAAAVMISAQDNVSTIIVHANRTPIPKPQQVSAIVAPMNKMNHQPPIAMVLGMAANGQLTVVELDSLWNNIRSHRTIWSSGEQVIVDIGLRTLEDMIHIA